MTFNSNNADDVMKLLVSKFGKPAKTEVVHGATGIGIKIDSFQAHWRSELVMVDFQQRWLKIDVGVVSWRLIS